MNYGFSVTRHSFASDVIAPPSGITRTLDGRSARMYAFVVSFHGLPSRSDSTRTTVNLTKSGLIHRIDQEVEVDLPEGVDHGYALQCKLEKLL